MAGAEHDGTAARRLHLAATVAALATAAVLLIAPTGTSTTTSTSDGGTNETTRSSTTLLETEGPSVLIPLLFPAVVAGLPIAARRPAARRRAATSASLVLVLFVLAAGLSIGLFFLPAAIVSVAAAVVSRRPQATAVDPE